MRIIIRIRSLGRRRAALDAVPMPLPNSISTVRELLTSVVCTCVSAYNARVRRGESDLRPMSEAELPDMARVGKLAFGVNYGGREADVAGAVGNALQGFEDGLYRVFLGQTELTALDSPIELHEGD